MGLENLNPKKIIRKAAPYVAGVMAAFSSGNIDASTHIDLETNPIENVKPTSETDPKNKTEGNVEKFEHVFDTGFDMGKADLSPKQIDQLKVEFIEFLNNLPQEVKDRINNGDSKIIVHGGASYHVIDPETGVNTGSRGFAYYNEPLARYRAEAGVEVLQNDVFENVSGIESASIDIETHIYGKKDVGKELEDGRRLRISIDEVIERISASEEVVDIPEEITKRIIENPRLERILNSDLVIIDNSGSTLEDAAEVNAFIKEVEDKIGKEIAKKNLGGGDMEAHIGTLKTSLTDLEDNTIVTIITDEPDSTVPELNARNSQRTPALEKYNNISQEVIDELNERNIKVYIQVMNPNHAEGGYKEFLLNDHPDAMIPLDRSKYFMGGKAPVNDWFRTLPGEYKK